MIKYLAAIAVIVAMAPRVSAQSRDGKLFDPGVLMTEPSPGAPTELASMQDVVGQWDVDYRAYRADTLYLRGEGKASITFMNRGHSIMERFYCPRCGSEDQDIASIAFLAYNPSAGVWNLGVADGYTESVSVSSGIRENGALVLHNAVRHRGGATLTFYRTTYRSDLTGLRVVIETSTDYQATWDSTVVKTYTRREHDPSFLAPGSEFGHPASNRDAHGHEFDFLIGTFDAQQQLTLPGGQVAKFPSMTTAVYALDGNGILEFNWYDVDQRLPDAATSIVRIYNRAMRRWESLYMTNRGNGALFFGGTKEDDKIVLGFFETDTGAGPIVRFVFHDMKKDEYHWYSESSTDRGEAFTKTWIIDVDRTELD
ncbi:hypothetical protein ACFLRO_01805 [Bacteroidota bacterium]